MKEDRKDEIGKLFLLQKEISVEALKGLELQEIIFLIDSAKYFKEKQAFIDDNFNEKIELFLNILKDKIKTAEGLYIAYDENTEYPYVDGLDRAWLFSKEEYALNAKDYFMQQLIVLEMKKIDKKEVLRTFAELHRIGIEKIFIDNGEYTIELMRNDILPPPDWSNTPKINVPVENPQLQRALIKFFQNLYTKNNFDGKQQFMEELENKMLREVIGAKYLIPMQLREDNPSVPDEQGLKTIQAGATMKFAYLVDVYEKSWLPAFTDWTEFEKIYDKSIWQGNIVTYEDLLALSEDIEGIVINSKGIPMQLNEKNKKMIEEFRNVQGTQKTGSLKEYIIKRDTSLKLGEPKDYPHQMINAVKEYMKKQRSIKKAYLRLMMKDSEKSYLIVVDFEGDKESIFKDITEVASPHLKGMYLDLIDMDQWALEAVKDVVPFYKKKLFGIF